MGSFKDTLRRLRSRLFRVDLASAEEIGRYALGQPEVAGALASSGLGAVLLPGLPTKVETPYGSSLQSQWDALLQIGYTSMNLAQFQATGPPRASEPPTRLEPPEHVVGPIVGYRQWLLKAGSGHLWGIGRHVKWPAGAPKQATHGGGIPTPAYHPAPGALCDCGYYLMREPSQSPPSFPDDWLCFVSGTAAGWGRAFRHESGWRTQYAWPLTVTYRTPMPNWVVPDVLKKELAAIARNYGCRTEVEECGRG